MPDPNATDGLADQYKGVCRRLGLARPDPEQPTNQQRPAKLCVTADASKGVVVLDVGRTDVFLVFTADEALALSHALRDKAFEARGIT